MRPGASAATSTCPPTRWGGLCSFECTFCAGCAEHLDRACPACGGVLMPRPTRVGDALERHPASTTRVVSGASAPVPGTPGSRAARARRAERLTRKPDRATQRAHRARRAARRRARGHALDGRRRQALGGAHALAERRRPHPPPRVDRGGRPAPRRGRGAGRAVRHGGRRPRRGAHDVRVLGQLPLRGGPRRATPLTGADRSTALDRISERLIPGRHARGAPDEPEGGVRHARHGACRSPTGAGCSRPGPRAVGRPTRRPTPGPASCRSGSSRATRSRPRGMPRPGTPVPASVAALVARVGR